MALPRDWKDVRFDTLHWPDDPTPATQQVNIFQQKPFLPPPPVMPPSPEPGFGPEDDPELQPGEMFFDFTDNSLHIGGSDGDTFQVFFSQDGFALPTWFILADEGGGTHKVEIQATLLNLLINGLPTSDPGFGGAWLSPT